MNKVLTFCKTHGYHIIGSTVDADGELSTYLHNTITPETIDLVTTEKLLAGWVHPEFNSYLWVFKDKWIGFVQVGDTITKMQATTFDQLQIAIIQKFVTEDPFLK